MITSDIQYAVFKKSTWYKQESYEKISLSWEITLSSWPVGKLWGIFLLMTDKEGPILLGVVPLWAGEPTLFEKASWTSHGVQVSKHHSSIASGSLPISSSCLDFLPWFPSRIDYILSWYPLMMNEQQTLSSPRGFWSWPLLQQLKQTNTTCVLPCQVVHSL